jgi:hypothetical protein
MKLLGKYIFYRGYSKKNVFAKQPFTRFEVTPHPNTFCKKNPSLSVIIKIPLILAFKFLKASHKHTQALH